MPTPKTPLIDPDDVIRRLNLKADQVEYGGDSGDLNKYVAGVIEEVSPYIQRRIGASDYYASDIRLRETVRAAEMKLVCANMLESMEVVRMMFREDPYPEEYSDHGRLESIAAQWRADAEAILETLEDADVAEVDSPVGFSIAGIGVDETEEDEYLEIDYGELEVEP